MSRVTVDDLRFAEDWLRHGYEAAGDDENGPAARCADPAVKRAAHRAVRNTG